MLAAIRDQTSRHRFECAREEQVQQQRLDEIVQVVAEGDLRRADLARDPIQDAAAEPGAERAGRGVASRRSSMTSPMVVCSMWSSQPRAVHVLAMTSCWYPCSRNRR